MKSPRILATSIAAALVALPTGGWAAQKVITATAAGIAWGTAGSWTAAGVPAITDNVFIQSTLTSATIVNYSSTVTSTNVQDLTFNGAGGISLQNNDAATNMTLTLNGRGTFTPLIATLNSQTYTIQSGTSGRTITLQLAQGGDFDVASGGTLDVKSNISQDGTARYLQKTGLGTLRMGGVNTFSGGLFIAGGKVSQSGSLLAASGVTVYATGTYEVTGNATNANTIAVETGGTFILATGGLLGSGATVNLTGGLSGNALGRIENATGSVFTMNVNNKGIARVTGTIAAGSTTNVNSGGIITGTGTVNGTTTIGTGGRVQLSSGNLTFSTLRFGTTAGHTATIQSVLGSKINVTASNGLTVNGGANSVSFEFPSVTATGDFVLLDYVGTALTAPLFNAFRIGQKPNRVVADLVNNTGNTSVDLRVTSFDFPIWTGALDGAWALATQSAPKNWVLNSNNATRTDFQALDITTFTDLASNTNVSINNGDVSPASVVFTNATKSYVIGGNSGGIAGTGTLTKSGAARVEISNTSNSFTGGVTINGGTLAAFSVANSGTSSSLGAGTDITINAATLEYTGFDAASTDRAITINAGGATIKTESGSVTLSGAISGAGNLTKTGAGTLVISGTNSYGNTVISEGVLQVGDANGDGTLGTGTTVTNNGELIFDFPTNAAVTHTISGTGLMRKRGGAALTLSGGTANTYSGGTFLDVGTLIAAKTSGINAIPGDLAIGLGATFLITPDLINQIADAAVVTIDGGSFGDPNDITATNFTDTFARINLNSGSFTTTRTLISGGINLTDRLQVAGGTAFIQRGGLMTSNRVDVASPGTIRFDGGSTTAANESKLTVGAGGLFLTGATLTFNTGNGAVSVVGAGSVGSILALNGNLTSTGISKLVKAGVTGPKGELNLGGAIRTFEVTNATDTLDLGSVSAPITVTNGGILKSGAGTLTLPGPQTYAQATTISGGKFVFDGSLASTPITVNAGGIFSGKGSTSGNVTVANFGQIDVGVEGLGGLTVQSLTLGSAAGNVATINLTRNSIPAIITVNNSGGLVANGGTGSVILNVSGTAPAPGTYILIDYNGTIGGTGFGAFVKGTLPNRVQGRIENDAGSAQIRLVVTASDNPLWSGALGTDWVTGTQSSPKNWVLNSNGTSPTDFEANDVAVFNDSAINTSVDISNGNVFPAGVRFENVTKTYTVTGAEGISGTTGFIKNGAGTVELFAPSSFTGSVTLNAGTVRVAAINDVGQVGAIGSGSTISFNGGTLEVTSPAATTNRAITINSPGGTISSDGQLTLDGNITGSARLTKAGVGTVILGGANSGYSAGVTIRGGRLQFFDPANLGSTNQPVTLSGGILEYSNPAKFFFADASNLRTVTVSPTTGGGISVLNGDPDDDGGMWFSQANALAGSGPLAKYGDGTLRLNAVNSTLTSNWTVTEGVLESAVAGSLGSGSVAVTGTGVLAPKNMTIANAIIMNGGAIGTRDGDSTVYSGAVNVQSPSFVQLYSFTVPANQQTITISGPMSGAGTLSAIVASTTANSSKTLTITNTANTFSGLFDIRTNQILLAQAAGGVGKTLGTASVQLKSSTLRIRDNGAAATDLAYGNSVIIQPTFAADGITPTVSTSTIDVDRVSANTAKVVRLGGLTVNAHTLPAFPTTVRMIGLNSFSTAFDGASSFTGAVTLNTDYDPVFTGPISGNGNVTLATSGRTLKLSNTTSTFSGSYILPTNTTLLSQPTTTGNTLGSATVNLTASSATILDNGIGSNGTLNYGNNFVVGGGSSTIQVSRVGASNTGNTVKMGGLSIGTGTSTLNVTTGSSYKLAFDGATTLTGNTTFNATADLELNGAISGSFGITKTGAGKLSINGTNTFTGNVAVSAGTLAGNGTIPGSLSATVSGATIAPGITTGVLSIGGSVSFVAGTNFSVDLARGVGAQPIPGEYDQLNIGTSGANDGTISLANSNLVVSAPGGLQNTDIFFIMINDGVDAVSGTFLNKAQGSTFVVNGYSLTISYAANSTNGSFSGGNDIALMVPEPTGVALMFGGLATLLCGRRRRP